jgi:hypothetical protein
VDVVDGLHALLGEIALEAGERLLIGRGILAHQDRDVHVGLGGVRAVARGEHEEAECRREAPAAGSPMRIHAAF